MALQISTSHIRNSGAAAPPSSPLYLGIFWKVLSCLCFAGVNGLVRYLAGGSGLANAEPLPIYTIMLLQHALGSIIVLPLLLRRKQELLGIIAGKQPMLHLLRVTLAALGLGLWYLSLQYIPLTQVIALSFAAPFIAIGGAVIFLHEQLTRTRIAAVILSFLGGFLISRPDLGLQSVGHIGWLAILPLLATLIFAADKIITRRLMTAGHSATMVTLLLIVGITPMCLILSLYHGWHTPLLGHWPWLLFLAVLGVLAHYSFSKAFEYAEITVLLPFAVTKILFCGIIGYLAFGELPRSLDMWLGICVATVSAVLLSYEKRPILLHSKPV